MDRYLKTLLGNIPGVIPRLVSVRQDIDDCRWVILVGGGDPYQVAWAIYYALFDISCLARPTIDIAGITNDNPIIVTTVNNHNLLTGMVEEFTEVTGMESLNFNSFPVTVLSDKTFSVPVDGTILGPWNGGGIVSPNPILQEVTINSYPDSYIIPFILPAQQLVTLVVTWQADSPNYISVQGMAQAAAPALVDYINSLYCGISPLNIYEMQCVFLASVKSLVHSENITFLNFAVSFDGVAQQPIGSSGVIPGDPNSYFYTTIANVSVDQGL
jgi:hypothetical protein